MRRSLSTLLVPLGIAACAEAPTGPQAASAEARPDALAAVSDGRMMDLSIALADARVRLLPAVAEGGAASASLRASMQRLDERLAAEDAEGVMDAASRVEAALSAIPAADAEPILAELDAVRLALGEVRASASGRTNVQEQ